MRERLIVANWKMYKTAAEAQRFIQDFLPLLHDTAQAIICPPITLLSKMHSLCAGSRIVLGVQNIYWENEGAYTGEISAMQALDAGAAYCLTGHSERRQFFNESAHMVALKTTAALKAGLKPIVCVGENFTQRENGQTLQILHDDILASLKGIEATKCLTIAYEPVWAIGTGQVATPQDAEEAIAHLRACLAEIWGELAAEIPILYGGSVKPDNISALLACPNIDGALVGGASLSAAGFAAIVNTAKN
ncbi:MAG: triose-phosphate isomerase [Firmicutes bacterium]|nr:triose-phosphate isomerase [Bacillota bacterium]